MSQPATGQFSGIFISYRRDDSSGHAGRLFDGLSARFGEEQVFMDIDQIEPGEDFVQVIESAVGSCEILVALIGRNWLTSRDESGRRLDNPNDFVRLEITAALVRGIPVIPVLVQGARMPRPQDLPEDLLALSRRHALELSDLRWKHDIDQLTGALEKILTRRREARRIAEQQEEERKRLEAEAQSRKQAEESERLAREAEEKAKLKREAKEAEAIRKLEAEEIEQRRRAAEPEPPSVEETFVTARLETSSSNIETINSPATTTLNEQTGNLKRVEREDKIIALAILALFVIAAVVKINDWLRTPISENSSPVSNQSTSNQQPTNSPKETNLKKSITNRIGMELVWIPPGSFMMGSENGDINEKPVHQVTIREGFYMGKYEVTQAQWRQVMGKNPSAFKGDSLPVEHVSWNDAQKFIGKLNELNDGFLYRLPSEAQWEYACRAGTAEDYAGNLDSIAWYKDNSGEQPHPVGQKQANAFGLYDMYGNVWEWCADIWRNNYDGAPTDGSVWSGGGDASLRALRGGSWIYEAYSCRCANRAEYGPGKRDPDNGFRVVASARR
ncbi:MAG TPA: SUMF1/EgtB/PvdO family nonheme iron enzyme [Pyrinomonadaceae bacterium]|nr:SUMF1/EgtB/PvdO family nonheme iron enzyme [Pyrinomonadaceae bacterium]